MSESILTALHAERKKLSSALGAVDAAIESLRGVTAPAAPAAPAPPKKKRHRRRSPRPFALRITDPLAKECLEEASVSGCGGLFRLRSGRSLRGAVALYLHHHGGDMWYFIARRFSIPESSHATVVTDPRNAESSCNRVFALTRDDNNNMTVSLTPYGKKQIDNYLKQRAAKG